MAQDQKPRRGERLARTAAGGGLLPAATHQEVSNCIHSATPPPPALYGSGNFPLLTFFFLPDGAFPDMRGLLPLLVLDSRLFPRGGGGGVRGQ